MTALAHPVSAPAQFASLPLQVPGVESLGEWLVPAIALALLLGGIVGAVAPVLPSGLLSLSGVGLYWWHTGYTDPGLFVLSGLVLVGLAVLAVEWFAGAISAKAGGASNATTAAATGVGFLGIFVGGPVGFLVGTAGTVFVLEVLQGGAPRESARAAGVTLLGMLTSTVLQVLLTTGMFLTMLVVVLV
ncbi:MAG: DUF456 domain-containing protein [Haloarculaceae archaeon]